MKKVQIEVTDEAHEGLLALQLKRKLEKNKRTSLAEITADVVDDYFKQKMHGAEKS
jgi:hypothetical protein